MQTSPLRQSLQPETSVNETLANSCDNVSRNRLNLGHIFEDNFSSVLS